MRTNVADVTDILDGTELTSPVITKYIESANVFVTAHLGTKITSDDLLEDIEKWVSAHMIVATRERVGKEAGAGGAFIKYAGQWGMGLNGTSYGQMAIMLDTTSTLEALAQGKMQASVRAIPNFDE